MPDIFTTFASVDRFELTNSDTADAAPRSLIQLAKCGQFWDPRYGKFSITEKMFDAWERNFTAMHSPEAGREGLPIDRDHGPERRGDTAAVGWVKKLVRKGKELWGEVEWTPEGAKLVADRTYAYLSPSFNSAYRDEDGRNLGDAILGVGLTNRPFLRRGMAPVCLDDGCEFALAESRSDSPPMMPELTPEVLKALGLDTDADEAKVLSAIQALRSPAPAPDPAKFDLDELAQASGKVLLDAATVTKLTAQAAAGEAAAKQLHQSKFDTAWTAAVDDGRVVPAMKPTFELAYAADAEATIKSIDELPKGIHISLDGVSGHGSDPAIPAQLRTEAMEGGHVLDEDRAKLDAKVLAYAKEHNLEYDAALDAVLDQEG